MYVSNKCGLCTVTCTTHLKQMLGILYEVIQHSGVHSFSECLLRAGTALGAEEAAVMGIQQALDLVEPICQWRETNDTYISPVSTFR